MGQDLRELRTARMRQIASAFVAYLKRAGLQVRINSVRRGLAEQRELYANFQSCGCSRCPPLPGRCYPVAAPGRSPHALGIAFDMSIEPRSALPAVGRLWESIGFRWGGRFNDPIHFDFYPRGYTPR